MKPIIFLSRRTICTALAFLLIIPVHAQLTKDPSRSGKLYEELAKMDSIVFSVVYTCNPARSATFFTDDLEFYHDKGGPMVSLKTFVENLEKNFCGNGPKLRREVVPGTLQVFPMDNYGAIQSGEHFFYVTENGQPEKLTGRARFTHLWQLKNNEWKIARVLSYDHREP